MIFVQSGQGIVLMWLFHLDCEDHIVSEPCDWMHGIIWEIQCKGIRVSYYLSNNLKVNIGWRVYLS